MRGLLALKNISSTEAVLAQRTLDAYSTGVDFADALHAAQCPDGERLNSLLVECLEKIQVKTGQTIVGGLSPWISESLTTPDLQAETGYDYTLNWCHDDQPLPMRTRSGKPFLAVPYPQELNDIPMIIVRQMDTKDFTQMIVDQLDAMLLQTSQPDSPPLVMGIALHPYIVGQPYRLAHLRRALQRVAAERDAGRVWVAAPGAIAKHAALALAAPQSRAL